MKLSGDTAPLFLIWHSRLVFSFTARPLYPRYRMDRRLGGPRVGLDVTEKTEFVLSLSGIKLRSLFPVPTELSRLMCT
jgi:hypothetical protein